MTPRGRPAPEPALADQAARDRIRTSLDESLIVEASAGTGKTTELVNRIVAVLQSGRTSIERIAAVTFTHKAAGELKLRLREELDRARQRRDLAEAERAALEHALEHLEEAAIGTIHAFCAQILRERPVEAQVDPAFVEMSEPESNRVYRRAFRAWLERQLSQESPGLRRAFARLAHRDSWDDAPPLEQLQYAGRRLVEWRDYPAPWRREPFAREEEIATLVRMTQELADLSSHPRRVTDNLYRALQPVRLLAQSIARAESIGRRDLDALESLLLKLGRDLRRDSKKGSGEYGGGVARETLVAKRDELMQWIEDFRRRADADLAAEIRSEMIGIVDEYERRKQAAGGLDFVDLLLRARNLIRDDPGVRRYLQGRFSHLFVDEFQDTDPLQAEILLLLSAGDPSETDWLRVQPEPGKLFVVGDPKQSIYKFRRADLVLYRHVRDGLERRGAGIVTLTCSFRSVPNIQHFVNSAFETEMATPEASDGHADWRPLERFREDHEGRPSVIALPVPRPYKQRMAREAILKSLPDAVAAFAAWLVNESGWGIQARDIAVLFRRRTQGGVDLTRDYARALEARGLPHLLAGSKSFHHREEVETLRAALAAIEWPDDELSVFATLKGSLFAVADELLFLYRHIHGSLHPFRQPEKPSEEFAPITETLDLLARLHRDRNKRPFAATVNDLLEAARAHAAFLLRPGGNQILANVGRVAELARTYETTGGISFRGFVEELAEQAEKEEASEAPVLEEDADGVRLMTVHGAKGLEFPVVILADMTARLSQTGPDQHIDGERGLSAMRLLRCAPYELLENEAKEAERERAEGIRVAYVAATRAKDLLVVPAVGDEAFPPDSWLGPLYKALYPTQANWRKSRPADGCPAFGAMSVLERPLDYDGQPEFSVRPGLIEPATGSHEVVWWDPAQLVLGQDGDRANDETLKRVLQEDGGSSMEPYRAWQEARAAAIHEGARPCFDVFLASQAPEPPPGPLPEVEYIAPSRAAPASGARFGTLVHAVLSRVPLDAESEAITASAELYGRILGASGEEIEAAREGVQGALRHPLLARARQAKRLHREYPVALRIEDTRAMEGVIDLAFVEEHSWVVVDFKTDADLAGHRARYERQIQWYVYALTRLTGLPGRGILFSALF
jgi:ATP-dependent exoDNAse (exonuclease V) beta subunit